jgi:hypothetical protein
VHLHCMENKVTPQDISIPLRIEIQEYKNSHSSFSTSNALMGSYRALGVIPVNDSICPCLSTT